MRPPSTPEVDRHGSKEPLSSRQRISEHAKRLLGLESEDVARQALELLKKQGMIADFRQATRQEDQEQETDLWITLHDGANLRVQVKTSAAQYLEHEASSHRNDIYYVVVAHQPPEVVAEKMVTYVLEPYSYNKVFHVLRLLVSRGFISTFQRVSRGEAKKEGGGFRITTPGRQYVVRLQKEREPSQRLGDVLTLGIPNIANASFDEVTDVVLELLQTPPRWR